MSTQSLKITDKSKQESLDKLRKLQNFSQKDASIGEFTMANKLGEQAYTEEQIHWVANMFGK